MAYYKDLREFLGVLEEKGKLRKVQRKINKDTELHPLVRWQFRGLPERERTGFLFENLTDIKGNSYNSRVATSVLAANREVYALGMKCKPDQIHERWREAYRKPHPPRLVKTGSVKEEIHLGDSLLEHGGLEALRNKDTGYWRGQDSQLYGLASPHCNSSVDRQLP